MRHLRWMIIKATVTGDSRLPFLLRFWKAVAGSDFDYESVVIGGVA